MFRFEDGDAHDVDLIDHHQKETAVPMKSPPHPGLSLRQNCIDPEGLTITDAARRLGVARHTLSRVVHGHAAISAGMAIRLEKAGWSNAEFWVRRQAAYDLAQARVHEDTIVVGATNV